MKDIDQRILSTLIFLMSIYSSGAQEEDDNTDSVPIPICDQPKDQLEKTGLKSKYFIAEGKSQNYEETKGFCNQRNLKMAGVTSQFDVDHIAKLTEGLPSGEFKFMLGYQKGDGNKYTDDKGMDMVFQNFRPGVLGSGSNSPQKCTAMRIVPMQRPEMVIQGCDIATLTLCQYNDDDECMANTAEEANRAEDEIQSVGMAGEAEFFIGTTQKTRIEADEFCSTRDASLLVILSQAVNEKVFTIAREFAATKDIHPGSEFWTNGRLDQKIYWEMGERGNPAIEESVNFMWSEGSPKTGAEYCITYSANPEPPVDGKVVSTFASTDCEVPMYFMCFKGELLKDFVDSKDMEAEMNATTTTEAAAPEEIEAETEPPVLPPFFTDKNVSDAPVTAKPSEGIDVNAPPKPSCYKLTELPTITMDPVMPNDLLLNIIKFSRDNHIEEEGIDIPYKPDCQWRKELVTLISKLFVKVCPGALIPSEYINTITVLISMYLNSVKEEHKATKVGAQVWEELMIPLNDCEQNAIPLSLTSKGMFANEWVMPEENRINRILIPKETVDANLPLNTIIDHFWSMYSLSMGNCMARADSPTDWAVKYFYNFNKDFMMPLTEAWTMPLSFDIGILIGDFDLETMNYNMRACTTAAYMRQGIADRQIVRPIDLFGKNNMNSMNVKTGQPIMNVLS